MERKENIVPRFQIKMSTVAIGDSPRMNMNTSSEENIHKSVFKKKVSRRHLDNAQ